MPTLKGNAHFGDREARFREAGTQAGQGRSPRSHGIGEELSRQSEHRGQKLWRERAWVSPELKRPALWSRVRGGKRLGWPGEWGPLGTP